MFNAHKKDHRAWPSSFPSLVQAVYLSVTALGLLLVTQVLLQPRVKLAVVQVQDESNIERLMRVITDQQQQIKALSTQVKGCDEDIQHNFKYPEYASDDLTGVLIGTHDGCGNTSALDAVILVHTSATHFSRRNRLRRAFNSSIIEHKIKVVFLIGHVQDAQIQIDLEIENREYGDTLIGTFLDTYQNLTLKAVMGFRWAAEECQQAKLVIKMDDDVLFMADKFFDTFWYKHQKEKPEGQTRSIYCTVWKNAPVSRKGKWKVGKNLFAKNTYHFPYCAGYIIVLTPDLIAPMYEAAKTLDFFWIDDVYMYGMVPDFIGGVKFWQIGRKSNKITSSSKVYSSFCQRKNTISNCTFWAVLFNDEDKFDSELNKYLKEYPKSLKLETGKVEHDTKLILETRTNGTNPKLKSEPAKVEINQKEKIEPVKVKSDLKASKTAK